MCLRAAREQPYLLRHLEVCLPPISLCMILHGRDHHYHQSLDVGLGATAGETDGHRVTALTCLFLGITTVRVLSQMEKCTSF